MRICLIILTLCIALNCSANTRDSLVNLVFNLAYNMNYDEAELILSENKSGLDDIRYAVLDIDMSYWKNVTGTDSPDYPAFEATLNKYSSGNFKGDDEKSVQLIRLSYQLRYEVKRLKLISAISTHQKTKDLFEELKADAQMQSPELFQLYNSMFLYFSNYLKAFGGKTKKENCRKAIASMEQLTESDDMMVKTLSSYFLGRTFLKYENDPGKGIRHFEYLKDIYPGNKKFPELLEECRKEAD